jgi:hypothetical protein
VALKAEAEEVRDLAHRIVQIIVFAQRSTIQAEDNPDLTLTITPLQKANLQAKVALLQADIKAITDTWAV